MMHVCLERDRTGWCLQHGRERERERETSLPPRFGRRGICAGMGAMPAGSGRQCLGVHAQRHQLLPPAQQLDR
jgi:hypothetical protein